VASKRNWGGDQGALVGSGGSVHSAGRFSGWAGGVVSRTRSAGPRVPTAGLAYWARRLVGTVKGKPWSQPAKEVLQGAQRGRVGVLGPRGGETPRTLPLDVQVSSGSGDDRRRPLPFSVAGTPWGDDVGMFFVVKAGAVMGRRGETGPVPGGWGCPPVGRWACSGGNFLPGAGP